MASAAMDNSKLHVGKETIDVQPKAFVLPFRPEEVGVPADPAANRMAQQVPNVEITRGKLAALEKWFDRNEPILLKWKEASIGEINSVKDDLAKVLGVAPGSIKLGYRTGAFATEFNVSDLNGTPVTTFTINKSLLQDRPLQPDPKDGPDLRQRSVG